MYSNHSTLCSLLFSQKTKKRNSQALKEQTRKIGNGKVEQMMAQMINNSIDLEGGEGRAEISTKSKKRGDKRAFLC